jgi:PAS domain S-box-containing protein
MMSDELESPPEIGSFDEAMAILMDLSAPLLSGLLKALPTVPLTEDRYRMLLEQVQAVTFMASFEEGILPKEVYVSPQIESLLGYTQKEWLEDPTLWYSRLHPADKDRWNLEFAATIRKGDAVRKIYRFLARDGRVVSILGDVRIQRNAQTGLPQFIQGVGFDVSELKNTEEKLRLRTEELEAAKEELRRAKDQELAVKQREIGHLRSAVPKGGAPEHLLLGSSDAMKKVRERIAKVAPSRTTVLITGESGTGKELVAKALHFGGPRAKRRFIDVNCAALPESLVESELFGVEEGVATGVKARPGKFEQADGGTLFLDEIGEMPIGIQAKLLRVLEERSFERVGGTKKIRPDVRVICATNRNLAEMLEKGSFREDLRYRFQVEIPIAPLRERASDILELADHFRIMAGLEHKRDVQISDIARQMLKTYLWRGNVRELKHAIEQAVLCCEGDTILPDDLPPAVTGPRPEAPAQARKMRLNDEVAELESRLIIQALQGSEGNKAGAARSLGTNERNLTYKMNKLGIVALRETPWVKAQ